MIPSELERNPLPQVKEGAERKEGKAKTVNTNKVGEIRQ